MMWQQVLEVNLKRESSVVPEIGIGTSISSVYKCVLWI
jgi:hypothetical protein